MHYIYCQIGMTKVAIPVGTVPFIRRVGQFFKSHRPTWKGTKEFMVGEPTKFYHEIRGGRAFAPGSLIRESLKAPGPLNKLLFYGWPAYDIYQTARFPSGPGKTEQIGGLLASTPVWIGGGKPLGMVGSTIAATMAERMGRGAGRMVEQAKQKLRTFRSPMYNDMYSSYTPPNIPPTSQY